MKKNILFFTIVLLLIGCTQYDPCDTNEDGEIDENEYVVCHGSVCGDGICDAREDFSTCKVDCATIQPSPVIQSVYVEGEPIQFKETRGDLWFSTWADDDTLLMSWGDGEGFDYQPTDLGFAEVTGTFPNIVGTNVFADPYVEPSCEAKECLVRDKPPCCLRYDDKPSSILFVDGTLYAHLHLPLGDPHVGYLAASEDNGATWMRYKDASPWTKDSNFRCMFFINMGKNYELNTDGYVYAFAIGKEWNWTGGLYLARVKQEEILDYNAYEYFVGVDVENMPFWSASQFDAVPLPDVMVTEQISAMYHPGVERYLILSRSVVYDAPTPWGPWTLAGAWIRDGWKGYQPGIVPKDTGDDSFWFTLSGSSFQDVTYELNLGQMKMEVREHAISNS